MGKKNFAKTRQYFGQQKKDKKTNNIHHSSADHAPITLQSSTDHTPLALHSSVDHALLALQSSTDHVPITIHSSADQAPITIHSSADQAPITIHIREMGSNLSVISCGLTTMSCILLCLIGV
jgi:hypothetical protein